MIFDNFQLEVPEKCNLGDVVELYLLETALRRFRNFVSVPTWGIEGSLHRARPIVLDPKATPDTTSIPLHPSHGELA